MLMVTAVEAGFNGFNLMDMRMTSWKLVDKLVKSFHQYAVQIVIPTSAMMTLTHLPLHQVMLLLHLQLLHLYNHIAADANHALIKFGI